MKTVLAGMVTLTTLASQLMVCFCNFNEVSVYHEMKKHENCCAKGIVYSLRQGPEKV